MKCGWLVVMQNVGMCYLILGLVKWESSCFGINYGWLVAMQNVGMCYGLEEDRDRVDNWGQLMVL